MIFITAGIDNNHKPDMAFSGYLKDEKRRKK